MAVSSLNKFTVPLASDQSASTQGLLMPKLKYRFRVSFENFGITTPRSELTKQVIDFTGIQNGKIHPSDIDAVLENKYGIEMPFGQNQYFDSTAEIINHLCLK